MTSTNDLDALEAIERDLRAAFAAPVPRAALRSWPLRDPQRPAIASPPPRPARARGGRREGALVATLVWLPAIGGAGTATVNARELIDRAGHANAAMASVGPAYHLIESVVQVKGITARTETWFAGAAGARTETTAQWTASR